MAHTTLTFPETVSLPQLVEWNRQLWLDGNEPEIRLDFCKTNFFTPFAMMFIIHQIRNYRKRFRAASIKVENYNHLPWPESMGFFRTLACELLGEKVPAPTNPPESQTERFLPITTLYTKDFKDENGRGLTELNEAVDREASRLAGALTQLGSGYSFDAVQYSLREVMRNVFEHSGAETLRYCAQYWPKRKKAELIIADCGMGIYGSLTGNPAFKNIKERDALHLACFPGVSGNAQAMKDRGTGNPWKNSGYGLYMTSRLCRNDGDFTLISSERALYLSSDRKKDFALRNTQGALIRLHLNLQSSEALRVSLARYTEEGKAISEDIQGAKVLEASVASQMLRRDFDKKTQGS